MKINITLIEGKDFHKNASKEYVEELCKIVKSRISKKFSETDEIDVGYRKYRIICIDKAKGKDKTFITKAITEEEWDNEEDKKWNDK